VNGGVGGVNVTYRGGSTPTDEKRASKYGEGLLSNELDRPRTESFCVSRRIKSAEFRSRVYCSAAISTHQAL